MIEFDQRVNYGDLAAIFGSISGVLLLCWKINRWFSSLGNKVDRGFAENTNEHDHIKKEMGDGFSHAKSADEELKKTVDRNSATIDTRILPELHDHGEKIGRLEGHNDK